VRRTAARLRRAAHYERIAWRRTAPIIKGQVLYEAFSGNGMLDNPEAIFSALLSTPDMQHLSHVWVLKDLEAYSSTVQRFADDPRVRFVGYGSDKYYEALARSEYLINNATFPPEFGKREGQVYINTWHGTPLKHMGYDIPGGGPATRNIVRNFVSADYLLSANEFMTKRMYESGYKLRGIYPGTIVQEGSPRVDRQFMTDAERTSFRNELVGRGVALDPDQQVVLYAPTWKGSFYAPVNDVIQLLGRIRKLNALIDTTRYRILLKVHQRVYDFAADQPELRDLLVPNDVPTNVMLGATDVLLTDYSSIFFDFLATGRPVLFHLPDESAYSGSRGLYIPSEQLPGPVSYSVEKLASQLQSVGSGETDDPLVTHAEAYASARKEFCSREDGHAADRIIDVTFRGRTEGYDVREDLSDGRTSILIFLGGMRANGITKSALSLLDNIDHERFDVSVLYTQSANEERLRNEAAINPEVRLFPRIGGINGTKLLWFGRQAMLTRGIDAVPAIHRHSQERALRDEWVRCFGAVTFDHIVDFSGYNPFWTYVLLQGEAKTHSMFLHNDLLADSQREVNGRRPHERNLRSVFSAYREFDTLISVSSALAEINRKKLASYASPEKFVSAANTTNYQEILHMAYGLTSDDPPLLAPQDRRLRQHPEEWSSPEGPSPRVIDIENLPGAIETLMQRHTISAVVDEVTRRDLIQQLVPPVPGMVTFVTAGRLSPEKNQARLIRAFDLVHRENPNTRLVILGHGPLRERLDQLVGELGLVTAVTLAGHQENPYVVMANSDCFVLSSDYEGQPMVLLEAMVLGLSIISTNFASVRGALPEGFGKVVPMSVKGLADGMRAYLRGQVPAPTLDYVTYNQNAVEQFYQAIGAVERRSTPTGTQTVIDVRTPAEVEASSGIEASPSQRSSLKDDVLRGAILDLDSPTLDASHSQEAAEREGTRNRRS
jgi:CDP-glycerol glycerophosphotransferase